MTPKEKAEELVRRYMQLRPHPTEDYLDNEDAKLCALIAVDEILKANPIVPLSFMLESEALNAAQEYWTKVKKEIENL